MTLPEQSDSPGDLMATVLRALDRDDLPLLERVKLATYVAAGGDPARPTTYGEIAEVAGLPASDVRMAFAAFAERCEAADAASAKGRT